jgi:hypothetical protein
MERLDERREATGDLKRTENLRDSEKRAWRNVSSTSETPGVLSSIGVFALAVWERGFIVSFF